jgi:F-type H+-transporting ATPase subunit a
LKTNDFITLLLLFLLTVTNAGASGKTTEGESRDNNNTGSKKTFDASSFIMDHIADAHEWHLYTKANGESVALYLPVIVYSKEKGLSVFSSRKLHHGNIYKGYKLEEEGELGGKIVSVNAEGVADEENLPLDLSVTKSVFGLFGSAVIGLLLFLTLARSYKKTGISHPKGIQSFLEPIILFVRDDIAISNLGHKYERYMPFLLSVFFFILINNLMGMVPFPPPFGANVTGNIAVTFVLATFSFFIIQFSGNRNYWRHVFATPGVPLWLLPIMIPVEIISIFAKPFALMIRLFANILAGHIVALSLVGLIFIFRSVFMAPVSAVFVIFMDSLEVLVAFLQAYVFTLLSALFISLAIVEEHH